MVNLRVGYDPAPQVDVLDITAERRYWAGTYPDAAWDLVVKVGENHSQDVIGLLFIGASGFVAPYFRVAGEKEPRWAGRDEFTRYDPAMDTLTWGDTTDAPGMVSHAGDITVYWQPDPDDAADFDPIGVALRNAAQHLAPHFEPVEIG